MFKFEREQRTFEISGVKIGGQPGEVPTVLVGSIFYRGHKIVEDEKRGTFDRARAEELIVRQEDFSDKTGNPCMLDVVGMTPQALNGYLEFVSSVTDAPMLMDGGTASNNAECLENAKEVGLLGRIVYNSLSLQCKAAEIDKIKEVGLESAVLLTLNMKDFTSRGKMTAARELVSLAEGAGIKKPLIDTCVLDIPTLGQACRAIFDLKTEFGLPAGCGAHNAISMWRGLKKKMGTQAIKPSLASACVMTAAVGADFVLYGPIEEAEFVFPVIAMADAAYGKVVTERGLKLDRGHPIYRIA